jgi:hypothetical protein
MTLTLSDFVTRAKIDRATLKYGLKKSGSCREVD